MGRAALVAGLLLLIVGIPVAIYVPLLDCPECEQPPCLRCGDGGRLTLAARTFGHPSHPLVSKLMSYREEPEKLVEGLGGSALLAWENVKDAFEVECTVAPPDM